MHTRPADRIVEPREQVRDGRLAAARRPDQTDHLPGIHPERDALDHLTHAVVAEHDVLELDLALHRLQPNRSVLVDDLRLGVEHLEDPMRRARRAVHDACDLPDDLDRRNEHRHVEHERDERAGRQRPAEAVVAEHPRHREHPDEHDHRAHCQHQHGPERGPHFVDVVELGGRAGVAATETRLLASLLVKSLHDFHSGNRVGHDVRQVRPLPPGAQEQQIHPLPVEVDPDAEKGHRQRHHQPEPPVERQQHHREPDQRDDRERDVHHTEREELPQSVGIGRHPRDQAAGLLARVERERQALKVLVQLGPQIAGHVLAENRHPAQARPRARLAQDVAARDHAHDPPGEALDLSHRTAPDCTGRITSSMRRPVRYGGSNWSAVRAAAETIPNVTAPLYGRR